MRIGLAAPLVATVLLAGGGAMATEDAFFAGKTIRVLVGYPPGSTFDNYARLATRHMGRHIPGNPTMIVQNMPGAGGLTATSNAANVAAPDGLTLALINPVNAMEPILNPDLAKFDARQFKWIGSMNSEVGTCGFWNDRIRTLDDLKSKTATLGATGPSSGSTLDAKAIQGVLGLQFKMVLGYPGLNDVRLAAENNEVDGFCGLQVSSIKATLWEPYRAGKFHVVVQTGMEKHPDLPASVPSIFELAPDEESRQILKLVFSPWSYGAPIMAPPKTPDARIAVLRQAFAEMMDDPLLREETTKMNLETHYLTPEKISALVADAYGAPKDIVERTRKLLGIEVKP
jgi:tripartite-type tricarboxylate transporter receptor subunit TctC